ncbi:MAG: glycosyltransferase family 2 protein [Eubacteriales bacterium]|nr:glycosyltransferase family 2 protein [Eubacteriales bacterium]
MEPAISVIVPVYNVAPYLRRCLDSILAQTYSSLELILVDDGSLDDSGDICDEYAERDVRVRVFHKTNGGASSARNHGTSKVRGAYLMYVDSDDYIEHDMVACQLELAKKHHADIVCCGYLIEGGREKADQGHGKAFETNWTEISPYLLQGELFYTSLCNKLYSRRMIPYLQGDEDIAFTEDLLVNYRVCKMAETIVVDPSLRYHYVPRSTSLVQHSLSESQFSALTVTERLMEYEKNDGEHLAYCRRHRDVILMSLITRIMKSNRYWERYPALRAEVLADYQQIMNSGLYNKKERITAFWLKYCPSVYRAMVWVKVRLG